MSEVLSKIGSRLVANAEGRLLKSADQTICLPGGIAITCHPDAVRLVEGEQVDRVSDGFSRMQELFGAETSVTAPYKSDVRRVEKRTTMECFVNEAPKIVKTMITPAEEFLNSNPLPNTLSAPEFHRYISQWVTTTTMKGLFGYDVDSIQASLVSDSARAVFISSAMADLLGNNKLAQQVSKAIGYDGEKAGLQMRKLAEQILNTSDASLVNHLRQIPDMLLSQQQKIAEIAVLLGGSTGNTAHTLTHLLLLLAHPSATESQQKLQSLDPQSKEYIDLMNTRMYQTLYMHPAVPFIRRTVKKPILLGDKFIPEGTKLVMSIHAMQRQAEYSVEPDQMSTDEGWKRSFGWGKRSCSGTHVALREIPMFAGLFLEQYQAQTNKETQQPIYEFPFIAYNPNIQLYLSQFSVA